MKIRELDLKSFGKFSEKKVVFHDGINVVYGENESGKSTVHTFIKSMLFGLERGRGRASHNDTFSLYEPWENPNYYAEWLHEKQSMNVYFASPDFYIGDSGIFARYIPVYESLLSATCSGVPVATTVPPPSPPSGPRSII